MSGGAALIETRRDEIVERFADHLYRTSASSALSRKDVINSLREYLDEIAAGLRAVEQGGPTGAATPLSPSAIEHGRQRFHLGYDLGALIREYGALRDILFSVLEEGGATLSPSEMRVISSYLIDGIADAATRYAQERDEALRKQASNHVAFLAHELRNPLASSMLAFTILEQKQLLPKDHRSVRRLAEGFQTLNDLIDRALVEVRLETGPDLNLASIPVAPMLQELLDESGAEAEQKHIRVDIRNEADAVRADPRLLHSALSNLFRNAVKFTRDGGTIQLRARQADHRVVFEVEDECGGLPVGSIEKVFDPYVQVGKDRSGFGLGLAIAKQAVDAHQGSLRVHNIVGSGCVFVLELPTQGPSTR